MMERGVIADDFRELVGHQLSLVHFRFCLLHRLVVFVWVAEVRATLL